MSSDIGKKIKELRVKNKLTLKELSGLTGLSTGFLSQFERGLSTIATDSLEKIADALGVPLSYLFPAKAPADEGFVLRSYERNILQVLNSKFINSSLSKNIEGKELMPRLVELLPVNSEEDIIKYPHDGEEFVYVLEGILTLFIDKKKYELYPGDTAHYSSRLYHNWANYTNKMTRLIVVSCPNTLKQNK